MEIKNIDELINYLKNERNIKIDISNKQNLINIGYFHGYKAYRFIKKSTNNLHITDFNEIISISNFDLKLKTLFYPSIMQLETITKNIVLELLIEEYDTNYFDEIFEKAMTDFKVNGIDKNRLKHRLRVYNNINSAILNNYTNNNRIITHFYSNDKKIPLWAIFEIITLGIFADFIKSLKYDSRKNICLAMNMNISYDTNAKFPEKILYLIKSIRNSIAHNDVLFDVRFKDSNIDKTICSYLENELGCINIDFTTITDYVLIVAVMLKKYSIDNTEIIKFVFDYENIIENFRKEVDISIYNQIIHTDIKFKLERIKNYINN